jgi:hypothetical protein
MTMTFPSGRLRDRKMSPFGAMRMTRAFHIGHEWRDRGIALSSASAPWRPPSNGWPLTMFRAAR